ncbi:MAG: SDR family oxidoreductase, partial [Acidimicrobiaceae bacterium]|nr:SDR family oxidoreductase [Acidimicrobiaceae bacterium]
MNIDTTRLEGKVAIVTGAASGIGAATARRLAAEGARVLLTDIQDEVGSDLASDIGNGATFQHCNVVNEADVAAAVQTAVDTWGRLDIVHNNAGFGGVSGPIESTTADGWASTLDVLLTSVFFG